MKYLFIIIKFDTLTLKRSFSGWGARFTYTLFVFLGMALCFVVRVDMSVVIIAMVDRCVCREVEIKH
jgi:hypothetical protein